MRGDQRHIAIFRRKMGASACRDALRRLQRADHRAGHRHGFEHLVLHPARDRERRNHQIGGGKERPHIGHLAPHAHAIPAIRAEQFRHRISANDMELGRG